MKLQRMSGKPVYQDELEAYTNEFRVEYDKAEAVHQKDMVGLNEAIIKFEKELQAKYKLVVDMKLPKSAKAWKELIVQIGAPILVAVSAEEGNEVIAVIMDENTF